MQDWEQAYTTTVGREYGHAWPVFQLEVAVAALHFKIDNYIFVRSALGHLATDTKAGVTMAIKRKRSLCGLSQSPTLWLGTIDKVLLRIGFTLSLLGSFVYTHGGNDIFAILRLTSTFHHWEERTGATTQEITQRPLHDEVYGRGQPHTGQYRHPRLQPRHANLHAEGVRPG